MNKKAYKIPKVKITHILSDGTVLNSIDGFKVTLTPETILSYKILAGNYKSEEKRR